VLIGGEIPKGFGMTQNAANAQKTILMIDDEIGPRESVRFLFKNQYRVFCEESVDKGVQRLKEEHPDVIIMDIKMPGRSGLEGLKEIRAVDPDVAVVMLTGFGTLESAQQAMRLGANDYVKKPFDTQEMRKVVEEHIRITEMARRRTAVSRQLQELNAKLELEIAETRHLASLGQASSELVHDLRNPLTVISGYLQLLMQDMQKVLAPGTDSNGDVRNYLDVIDRNVRRCQEMSKGWRELGKRNERTMEPCSIAALVSEAATNSQPLAQEVGAKIQVAAGPPSATVLADVPQLYRALQNVIGNAIHAVPRDRGIVAVTWRVAGDTVEIAVEDNGPGIAEEHQREVFSGTFTTKAATGGMGLGLFITKKVIEGTHLGEVLLENRKEGGLRVTFRLQTIPPPA
jgi:signal transduction histidine kinase